MIEGVLIGVCLSLYEQLASKHFVCDCHSWEYKGNSPFSEHVLQYEKSTGYKVIGELNF